MHAHHIAQAWRATLDLRFERRERSTILRGRRHTGPLQVQKALYPEDPSICHVAILHPPGGIAAHDRLDIAAALEPSAHAVLTTPGAAKWYRSTDAYATQRTQFHVGANAVLEWLPRENILFDGSRAAMTQEIHLARGARYVGWEILCFGRRASGERWSRGGLRLGTRVFREGRLLWSELADVAGQGFANSPIGLAGRSVSATLIAAGCESDAELMARCRGLEDAEAHHAMSGLTWLPGIMVARHLGDSAERAFAWVSAIWRTLRPALTGAAAQPLRIWAC